MLDRSPVSRAHRSAFLKRRSPPTPALTPLTILSPLAAAITAISRASRDCIVIACSSCFVCRVSPN